MLALIVLACSQGLRPPDVPPGGTLGLTELDPDDVDVGPLRVVYASPRGALRGPSEITVLFSKPMRPLELAGNEAPFPGKITPEVPGEWQWVGTRAASFIPKRAGGGGAFRLPLASRFEVKIPKGTRSLDGELLSEDYVFSFETERPALTSSNPGSGSRSLEPASAIDLFFNVPVEEATIRRNVRLTVGDDDKPFSIERPEAKEPGRVRIKPTAPLPLDTALSIAVDAGLTGTEGPLTAGKSTNLDFRTYGPLRVTELTCYTGAPNKRCAADTPLTLSFSNAVNVGLAKKAISVDPPVKLTFSEWLSDEEETGGVSISGRFLPGRKYTIKVAGKVVDTYGQSLEKPFSESVDFGDLWPTARIGLTSGVLEASARREITVGHINTTDLEIAAAPLAEDDILALEAREVTMQDFKGRKSTVHRTAPAGRKNVLERTRISIDEVLGSPTARGSFAVFTEHTIEASSNARNSRPRIGRDRAITQVTDLAISAKVSRSSSVVWVTRLSDASPVAGAQVKIRRGTEPPVVKTTDPDGFVTVTGTEFAPKFEDERAVIFVRSGDDFAYRPVSENVDHWQFDPGEDSTIGMLFTERGIYRPGDTVRLKGILREPLDRGLGTPAAGQHLAITVQGPAGEDVAKLDATTTAFGTYAFDVKIPKSLALGESYVTVTDGKTNQVGSTSFEISEYRPVEFKVTAESDRPAFVRGDSARWTTRGDFLFGAPMAGAEAEISVHRSETYFSPPGMEDFLTSDDDYLRDLPDTSPREYELASSKVALDAAGVATTSAKLAMPGQRGPETVTCSVDVSDVSRQVVSSSTTAIVHPAAHYVGVALSDWFVPAKAKLTPKFVAAAPNGERLVGRSIQVTFYKRSWAVAKQGTGAGAATTVATPVDVPAGTCALVSSKAPVGCDLFPADAGYYIVRATSTDASGNPVSASRSVYVTGESSSALSLFPTSDSTELELVADRETYDVGQKAKILVKSPWRTADALVTVERSGIFERRRVKLVGPAPTIEVTITEDMRPNAFVSVLVHRARSQKAPAALEKADVGAPAYKLGIANLVVDPASRRLAVEIKPDKADLLPGSEIAVALTVKDRGGKPARAELTVYAVDEGVLSLNNYKTPDPVALFAAPRDLHVATLEARSSLASMFDPLSGVGLDKGLAGGGGGESASPSRKDFRAAAYWNPNVVTSDQGTAEVRFKVPDSLTTYRLMAVAVGADDRFGSGEARVTTSRPLMVRPALPRFLRAGDTFDASVIVTSKGAVAGEVEVTAKVSGVSLDGPAAQRVRVDAGRSVEIRFPARAARVGDASFRFDVKGGGADDAVTVERAVTPPIPLEAVALYGATSSAAAEKLGDLSRIRDDVGGLTLTMASTALVGLDGGATQLLEYPYGCTEQLTSKLVPLVALDDLRKEFGLPRPANTADVVEKTVSKIVSHQRADGGFGFWADSPEASPWATAYALYGLAQAKKRGVYVPELAITDGIRYLRGALQQSDKEFLLGAAAFAVDVLAELGVPDPGRATTLFERRGEMPLYSRAILLHALVLSKSSPEAITTLSSELEASVRLDGAVARTAEGPADAWARFLDSENRTTALVLRGLVAARPGHPLAAPLAKGLLQGRRGAAWNTTQETAWSLLALSDFHRAQEKEAPSFVARTFFGQELAAEHAFEGRSLDPKTSTFPAAQLLAANGAPMTFEVQGDGKLYYEARLRYARRDLPKAPIDRGFFVEKRMRPVTASSLADALDVVPDRTETKFVGGDLILVDVVVVSPKPRRFVAIDDPLPAGFEAIDMRLATSSGRLGGIEARGAEPSYDDDDDDDIMSTYYTKEVRDDRVLFFVDDLPAGVFRYRYLARATALGSFVVPPTRAEEMYAPEIFGRTAADVIKVAPKTP